MRKIVAFHSYKGGTGKTLFSINLATTYANRGKKICLFDLDFRAPSLHAAFKTDGSEYWLNPFRLLIQFFSDACKINTYSNSNPLELCAVRN